MRAPSREVAQDFERGEPARRAHDPAARVRAGATLIEALDRRAVAGPRRRGAKEEELVQRQLALEDVPLAQTRDALDVGRRDDLPVHDRPSDVWREAGER